MRYVHNGGPMYHIVRGINGGVRTVCGRLFPIDSPIFDRALGPFVCRQCMAGIARRAS